MDISLEELERLAAQADPLPWKLKLYLGKVIRVTENGNERYIADCLRTDKRAVRCKRNAAYIVAACNSLPVLIAENRALQERARKLERQTVILASHLSKYVMHTMSTKEWLEWSERTAKEASK